MAEATAYSGLNRRYLHMQDLRQLRRVVFAARRPVEGLYAGRHASRMRGHSVEFNDYRPYMPGDEVTDIDWKVYGRSDKLFVKLFEHQADMTVHLLIDASASMAFRGVAAPEREAAEASSSWVRGLDVLRGKMGARPSAWSIPFPSKYDQACRLAAAIAFVVVQQQDRVSTAFAAGGLQQASKTSGSVGHLVEVLAAMETISPRGPARLAEAIHDLAAGATRRALLVVLSDLYEDRDPIMDALGLWLHRGGEAILFQVLHADELKLPEVGTGLFVDAETAAKVRLNVADVRAIYDEKLRGFLDGWAAACRGRGIDYNRVSTAESYAQALRRYLLSRAARG